MVEDQPPCCEAMTGLSNGQLTELGIAGSTASVASTFRKVLARLDAATLDQLVGPFLWTRSAVAGGRRMIAIDGKTVRGARPPQAWLRIWCRRSTTPPAR